MNSPFSRNKHRKKKTWKTHSQTHTTNEHNKHYKNTKSNKKNDLKFGSVLEKNHLEDKIKFITLARKTVGNVYDLHSLNGQDKLRKNTR